MKLKKMNESIGVVKELKEMDKIIDTYVQDRIAKTQLKSANNRIKEAVKEEVLEVTGAMVDFAFENIGLLDEDETFFKKLDQISLNEISSECNISRTTAFRYRKERRFPDRYKNLLINLIDKNQL